MTSDEYGLAFGKSIGALVASAAIGCILGIAGYRMAKMFVEEPVPVVVELDSKALIPAVIWGAGNFLVYNAILTHEFNKKKE
jgi:hypothetical protein